MAIIPKKHLLQLNICLNLSNFGYSLYDPSSVPNNSFGIHIANIQDLEDAAKLVNSGGSD